MDSNYKGISLNYSNSVYRKTKKKYNNIKIHLLFSPDMIKKAASERCKIEN